MKNLAKSLAILALLAGTSVLAQATSQPTTKAAPVAAEEAAAKDICAKKGLAGKSLEDCVKAEVEKLQKEKTKS